MHVAMIGLRGIPSRDGGVEVAVGELAPRLVQGGFKVTVYCRNHYQFYKGDTYRGVGLVGLPTINRKHLEAPVHTLLATIHAIYLRVDIIHYHAMGNALFCWIPKLFGIRTCLTVHGLDYEREKWSLLAKWALKAGEKTGALFADRIIGVSKKLKRHFQQSYQRDIAFIPNGIPKLDIPAESQNYGRYILFMSRLVPEKGAHFLIEAFKELEYDGSLLIVGAGTHSETYVKQLKDLAAPDPRIKFLGAKYNGEKTRLFQDAEIFVLPSTIEGMPIVLLEALSQNTVCLVSDIEENMDVIVKSEGKLAYHFASKSSADLKSRMKYMLAHSKSTRTVASRGAFLVRREYNWDIVSQKTAELYCSLNNQITV